jgi:hypothetical protein
LSSEVQLLGVSAAEIIILRHIHGDDSVVRIEPGKETVVDQFALRDQLRAKYEHNEHKQGLVVKLLGPDHMNNLPDALDPAQEAQYREAVASAERVEAESKAALEAEIQRRVDEQLAQIEADRKAAAMQEVINADDPVILNAEQIKARDEKRAAALKMAQQLARDGKAVPHTETGAGPHTETGAGITA